MITCILLIGTRQHLITMSISKDSKIIIGIKKFLPMI